MREDGQAVTDQVPDLVSLPAMPLLASSVPRLYRHGSGVGDADGEGARSDTAGIIFSTRITSARSDSAPSSRAGTLASSQAPPK